MSIQIMILTETADEARAQMAVLLGDAALAAARHVTATLTPLLTAAAPTPAAAEPVPAKRTKKDKIAAETPPILVAAQTAPTPPPVVQTANPFADAPPTTTAAFMSFDDFKKRCNALIEVIPGNDGFDKASELLQKHAGVLMVKEVPAERYEAVALAFDAAIAEYEQKAA